MRAAIIAALVVVPAVARAQSAAVPFGNCADLATCLQLQPPPPRSPTVAIALSLGTTLAGIAAFAVAGRIDQTDERAWLATGAVLLAIGPTTGHAYAGSPLNAGLAVRLASGAVGLAGLGLYLDGESLGGGALVVAGAIGYLAGTLYEIGDAPAAADRYNRRHTRLAPIAGRTHAGLAITGAF
ncbi:MAG: hypothetical protein ABI867_00280 [Kofleriaceae bacterium]